MSFGGGKSQLLEEGSLPRDLLESQQSCVVDVTTGNSQTLLPPSATEWANSVKSIVERCKLLLFYRRALETGLEKCTCQCDRVIFAHLITVSLSFWHFLITAETERAYESLQNVKLVWLPSSHPVTSTAIRPVKYQTQVGDQEIEKHFHLFHLFVSDLFVSFVCVLDTVSKMKPRIPSASLSQSTAVDETMLPAASQNITAYAANTEQSQRYGQALTGTHYVLKLSKFDILVFAPEI